MTNPLTRRVIAVACALALLMLTIIGPIGFIAIVVGLPLWVLAVTILLWRRSDAAS